MECPQCGCDLDVILNDHTYEHRLECANDDCDFVYSVARLWNDKTRSESLAAWLRNRVAELEPLEDAAIDLNEAREQMAELSADGGGWSDKVEAGFICALDTFETLASQAAERREAETGDSES
jgi:hypothetical protein